MKWYKCRVRNGYYVHLKTGGVFPPGSALSLPHEQYEAHSHQLDLQEIVDPDQPSPASKTPAKSKEVKPHEST